MADNKMRVLILDGVASECAEILKREGIEAVERKKLSPDELAQVIGEFDAVAIRSATKLTRELIETGSRGRLKLIVRVGAGVNNIDIQEATRRSVVVENTPGTNARAVMELTIGALIAMARNLVHAHIDLKQGRWEKKKYAGRELHGKTLGIIGLGRIGQGVADLARKMGMQVIDSRSAIARKTSLPILPKPLIATLIAIDLLLPFGWTSGDLAEWGHAASVHCGQEETSGGRFSQARAGADGRDFIFRARCERNAIVPCHPPARKDRVSSQLPAFQKGLPTQPHFKTTFRSSILPPRFATSAAILSRTSCPASSLVETNARDGLPQMSLRTIFWMLMPCSPSTVPIIPTMPGISVCSVNR